MRHDENVIDFAPDEPSPFSGGPSIIDAAIERTTVAGEETIGSADEPQEDLLNADRLVSLAKGHFLAVHRGRRVDWLCWDGRHWSADGTSKIFELGREVPNTFLADAARVSGKAQDRYFRHVRSSQRAPRIAAMVDLAGKCFPEIKVLPGQLDADAWALTVRNGILDLRTGELRPHAPEALCSKLAPVDFLGLDAPAPRWTRFLGEVLPGVPDSIAFLQRSAGYSVTGHTREQVFWFLTGGGRNGKGVFLRALKSVLGPYAVTAGENVFVASQQERHTQEVARLEGARFIFASEIPTNRRWNEARLKSLTGNDPISAHLMYENDREIDWRGKIWIAANDRPRADANTSALWDRMREIRFPVHFRAPEDTDHPDDPVQDPALDDALVDERPGILAWMVQGALDWKKYGLLTPTEVREAVASYRDEVDPIAHFLAECTIPGPDRRHIFGDAFKRYTAWADQANEGRPLSSIRFSRELAKRGFPTDKTHGRVYVTGLSLQGGDDADRPAE